jgi:hypothetical protein
VKAKATKRDRSARPYNVSISIDGRKVAAGPMAGMLSRSSQECSARDIYILGALSIGAVPEEYRAETVRALNITIRNLFAGSPENVAALAALLAEFVEPSS